LHADKTGEAYHKTAPHQLRQFLLRASKAVHTQTLRVPLQKFSKVNAPVYLL
jgi:hypothetical protein